jgi:predicted deacetylase
MKLIVSLHDVHPKNFEQYEKYIQKLHSLGIVKTSILAVPYWHKEYKTEEYPEFCQWLNDKHNQGHEILLHSFYHIEEKKKAQNFKEYITANFYTAGEGEFFRISFDDAKEKIEEGLQVLNNINIHPQGFVAPAWLVNDNTIEALKVLDFKYTTTFHGIHSITQDSFIQSPVIVYSSRSFLRRTISCIWEPIWTKINKNREILRVALHPCDLCFTKTEKSITNQIIYLLKKREAITYSELINQTRN